MSSQIENIWASLGPSAGRVGLSGVRAPELPTMRAAYLALDSAERRHLMVRLSDDALPLAQRDTRGLEVQTERLQVGDHPESLFVDLVCLDRSHYPTFVAVAEDVLNALRRTNLPARDVVASTLARWRAFWSVRPAGLSSEEALGLFGELWFLRRWLDASQTADIERWMATPGSRHDFQWPAASVEVKTAATAAAEGPVHRITSLDQLADPEQGRLFLFSLQVADDALATNCLAGLVVAMSETLRDNQAATERFNQKLAEYGYSPRDAGQYQRKLRVVAERLFHVQGEFPRLTRHSFPLCQG